MNTNCSRVFDGNLLEKRMMQDWNHCLAFMEDNEYMELWVLIVAVPVLFVILLPKRRL